MKLLRNVKSAVVTWMGQRYDSIITQFLCSFLHVFQSIVLHNHDLHFYNLSLISFAMHTCRTWYLTN